MERSTRRQAAQGSRRGPELIVLTVIAAAAGIIGLLWAGAALVAVATGTRVPALGPTVVLRVIDGGYRRIPLVAHLAVSSALTVLLGMLVLWAYRRVRAHRSSPKARVAAFMRKPGWAEPAQITDATSAKRLLGQARELRPTLTAPRPSDVGYLMGTANGKEVWASCERSVLVLGPPGSGKGLYLAINMLLDAPGPVVTTGSSKPDNIKATLLARRRRFPDAPIGVFDPQGLLNPTAPYLVSWDIIAGCEEPSRAAARAEALARNSGIGDESENSMWRDHAKNVIEGVLHAVAVYRAGTGRSDITIDTAHQLLLDASGQKLIEAADYLRQFPDHPGCARPSAPHLTGRCTWASVLESYASGEHRFISSVMSIVQGALAPLNVPSVVDALTPSRARPPITAEDILDNNGTLYALATARGDGAAAGMVSALIEDITHTARRKASRRPGGRLDPPPLILLDEAANTAPIPSLPTMLADMRGQNVTVVPIFQTIAQIESIYGANDAGTIFTASTVKIVLGGSDDPSDTKDFSSLIGEFDEVYETTSRSATALLDTKASASTTVRRRAIVEPSEIRSIPAGVGIMMQSQAPAFPLGLRDWRTRPDAAQLRADQAILDEQFRDRQ